MMIYIIIYLIGYVLAYYILKSPLEEQDWEDVIVRAFVAVFSWGIVLLFILDLLVVLIGALCEKLPKPPKWL